MNTKILPWIIMIGVVVIAIPSFMYEECRIDVPNKHMAILTHKIGKDLERGVVLAPSPEYKGVQKEVLDRRPLLLQSLFLGLAGRAAGRNTRRQAGRANPHVRRRSAGGRIDRLERESKGNHARGAGFRAVIPSMRRWSKRTSRGRITPRLIELHDPVTIPAGYKGLITDLSAPVPKKANELVSAKGERGVQSDTLGAGHVLSESLRAGRSPGRLPQPALQSQGHRFSDQGRFLGQPGGDYRISRQTRTGRATPISSSTRNAKAKTWPRK